jgi:hypothetical protein
MPLQKQVLLEFLQVIHKQNAGEQEEPAEVVTAPTATSATSTAFTKAEWWEASTSIIKFRTFKFPFGIRALDGCSRRFPLCALGLSRMAS